MSSNRLVKHDSLEDFEFLDADDDLDIDLSKSPIHGAAEKFSSGIALILSALSKIIDEQGLVVQIEVKAIAATAVGAVTGSLLAGPPGLAVGLITGALIGYHTSPNRLKSSKNEPGEKTISQIFKKMTFQQKKDLIKELFICLKQPNVKILIVEIVKNEEIRNMALSILSNFLMKRMGICLTKPK